MSNLLAVSNGEDDVDLRAEVARLRAELLNVQREIEVAEIREQPMRDRLAAGLSAVRPAVEAAQHQHHHSERNLSLPSPRFHVTVGDSLLSGSSNSLGAAMNRDPTTAFDPRRFSDARRQSEGVGRLGGSGRFPRGFGHKDSGSFLRGSGHSGSGHAGFAAADRAKLCENLTHSLGIAAHQQDDGAMISFAAPFDVSGILSLTASSSTGSRPSVDSLMSASHVVRAKRPREATIVDVPNLAANERDARGRGGDAAKVRGSGFLDARGGFGSGVRGAVPTGSGENNAGESEGQRNPSVWSEMVPTPDAAANPFGTAVHSALPRTVSPSHGGTKRSRGLAAGVGGRRRREGLRTDAHSWIRNNDTTLVTIIDICFVLSAVATSVVAIIALNGKALLGDINAVPGSGIVVVIVLCQAFSALWMWSRLFVRTRLGEWQVADRPETIRARYLRTWFFLDLLYTAPIEFIFVGWANAVFQYLLVRHFLRWIRVVTLASNSNPLIEARQTLVFTMYVCGVFLLFFIVSNIMWAGDSDLSFLDALYWSAATLCSVGYGDVQVRSRSDRIAASFVCVIAVFVVASVSAWTTALLTTRDALSEELENKKKRMYSMLNYYDIPWNVQKEVISLFPTVLDAQSESQFHEMIADLPPFVKAKIAHFLRVKMLKRVPLFRGLSEATMTRLASATQQRSIPAHDFLMIEGETASEMFIIIRGLMEVFKTTTLPNGEILETVLRQLGPGFCVGEIALMMSCKRTATVQARVASEVLVLSKVDFDVVAASSPELQMRFEHLTHQRLDELSAAGLPGVPSVPASSALTNAMSTTRLRMEREQPPPPPQDDNGPLDDDDDDPEFVESEQGSTPSQSHNPEVNPFAPPSASQENRGDPNETQSNSASVGGVSHYSLMATVPRQADAPLSPNIPLMPTAPSAPGDVAATAATAPQRAKSQRRSRSLRDAAATAADQVTRLTIKRLDDLRQLVATAAALPEMGAVVESVGAAPLSRSSNSVDHRTPTAGSVRSQSQQQQQPQPQHDFAVPPTSASESFSAHGRDGIVMSPRGGRKRRQLLPGAAAAADAE